MSQDVDIQDEIALSPQEIERLNRNEILTWIDKDESTNSGTGRAMGIIDAEPGQVFRVLNDVERFSEYMERVKDCRVVRRDGDTFDYSFSIDMPWPLKDLHFLNRNVVVIDEQRQIYQRRWIMLEGSLLQNDGAWVLYPWDGGRTRTTYTVTMKPKIMLPQMVIDHVTKLSLPGSIKNVRSRIAELISRNQL